jgi:hypothetical protein
MSTGAVSLSTTPLIAGDTNFSESLSPDALMVYLQSRLDGLDKQVNTIFNDQKRQQEAQEHLRNLDALMAGMDDKAAPGQGQLDQATDQKQPAAEDQGAGLHSDRLSERLNVPNKGSALLNPPTAASSGALLSNPPTGTTAVEPKADVQNTEIQTKIKAELAALANLDPSLGKKMNDFFYGQGGILNGDDNTYSGDEVTGTTKFLDGIGKDLESQAALNMIRLQSIMSSRQTAVQLATNMVSNLGETTKSIVTNIGH